VKLVGSVGRVLDNTGYDGQVVIRSPWTTVGGILGRVYVIYPLRAVAFAFEEEESGLRDEFDAADMLRANFLISGQMSKNTFLFDPSDSSVSRDAAVVKYAPGPGDTMVVDTTDGAEWKISKESFDRCNLGLGDEIEVSTLLVSGNTASLHGPPTLSIQKGGVVCKLTATFVKGW